MIELLKNCSNGNEVSTYLAVDNRYLKKIVKTAATSAGVDNLKREIEGWQWYQNIRYPGRKVPICLITHEKKSFLRIEIEFIEGERVDCRKGLEVNENMIRKIIKHYCEIWPYSSATNSVFHGDLSLDNVICNSEGVHIIDWEHFFPKGAPWGFDPLYLLFETLFLNIRNRKAPSKKEIEIIVNCMNTLNRKNALTTDMLEHPLKFLVDFIIGNSNLWGESLEIFQNKFPILAFTPERVASIDNLIKSNLMSMRS